MIEEEGSMFHSKSHRRSSVGDFRGNMFTLLLQVSALAFQFFSDGVVVSTSVGGDVNQVL